MLCLFQVLERVYLDPSPLTRRFRPLWLNLRGFANSTSVSLGIELGSEKRPFFSFIDQDGPFPVSKVGFIR